jgi:ADP-ribosyl-[dinitrogen reductase] hydrolase
MLYACHPRQGIERAADSSRTTHGAPTAVDACRYLAALIIGALNGLDKAILLSERYCPVIGYWEQHPLTPEIDEIANGSFKHKAPPAIVGSGYVVKSLEAALWAFYQTDNFRDGCLQAVNLGDDADTTGAVYGQIAGAYYGESSIPLSWRDRLSKVDLISAYANRLFDLHQR